MSVTPYYTDDFATIYHADCREVLPAVTADVILTDLPYGIGVDYDGFDDSPLALADLVASSLPLMRSAAPVVALTCGIGNWWRYPEPTWVLCWHQSNSPTARGRWGFNQWQPIIVYGKDPYLVRGRGGRSDVVSVGVSRLNLVAARDSGHPCAKPLGAWAKVLVRLSPDPSDVIVDPFMGSGTTLAAAKYAGRRCIGIEQSERYCEIAANRLAQGVIDYGGVA